MSAMDDFVAAAKLLKAERECGRTGPSEVQAAFVEAALRAAESIDAGAEAISVPAEASRSTEGLQAAAQALVDRWHSPQWKWLKQGPTADLVHALDRELATFKTTSGETGDCGSSGTISIADAHRTSGSPF